MSSGMAAISLVFLATLRCGDHVVAHSNNYAAAVELLETWCPRLGIEVSRVDPSRPGAFEAEIRPETRLLYAETPSNPLLAVVDLEELGALGRKTGIPSCVDSTFGCPVNQKPLDYGVDLVVHSATKTLSGHSDVTAGVVVGSADWIARLWQALRVIGMVQHPFEAWLLWRGLQTLQPRVERGNATALRLARSLEDHPMVRRVLHLGLPSHPQHELARRQMIGFGSNLSFELVEVRTVSRFLNALELVRLAVSLGGVETLAAPASSSVFAHLEPESRRCRGLAPGLIRLAVGLEDPAAPETDLRQALDRVGVGG